MKPFDPKAKCPKCGCKEISAYFHAKGDRKPLGDYGYYEREILARRCDRCKYEWHEAPLDVKGNP